MDERMMRMTNGNMMTIALMPGIQGSYWRAQVIGEIDKIESRDKGPVLSWCRRMGVDLGDKQTRCILASVAGDLPPDHEYPDPGEEDMTERMKMYG